MHAWIVWILELLRHEHARVSGLHLPHARHRPGDAFLGRGEHQVGAQAADQLFALLAHVFRHDDADLITLEPSDQRDADAGVAGGGFDDDRIGPQPAIALGTFDHGQRDTVLDAAAGIEELGLGKDGLVLETDQRCMAD
jgi:hypothetical protein